MDGKASRRPGRRGEAAGLAPLLTAALLGLGLVGGALGCQSQEDYRIEVGGNVFDRNCARCHGKGGEDPQYVEGYGGEAPDLRLLSSRYGSPLPRDELARFIDGRSDVEAHGPRAMPVWGKELYDNLPENEKVEAMRAGTVDLLLDYLETIQIVEAEEEAEDTD